jgi:hypothetical protein
MLIPGVALISGLIATYVSLQNRALLAEVRKEIAELETRLIENFSDKFVRIGECALRGEVVNEKLRALIASHKLESPRERSEIADSVE